jgi:hypothetical protein
VFFWGQNNFEQRSELAGSLRSPIIFPSYPPFRNFSFFVFVFAFLFLSFFFLFFFFFVFFLFGFCKGQNSFELVVKAGTFRISRVTPPCFSSLPSFLHSRIPFPLFVFLFLFLFFFLFLFVLFCLFLFGFFSGKITLGS